VGLADFYRRAFGCETLAEEEDRIWLAAGAEREGVDALSED
jgi:hypothetical protein